MSQQTEIIHYDIEPAPGLREEFQRNAQILDGGKRIVVGELVARKKASPSRLFGGETTYHISIPDMRNPMIFNLSEKFSTESAQSQVISLMARWESERSISQSDKDDALRAALLVRLHALEAKP